MPELRFASAERQRRKLTNSQLAQISKLYEEVAEDFEKKIADIDNNPNASAAIKKQYLKKHKERLKDAVKETDKKIEKQLKATLKATATAIVKENAKQMAKYGLKIKGAYSFVPKEVVETIISGQLYGKGWSLSKAIWGNSKKAHKDIETIVAKGIAANKSAYEIAKDLAKYVSPSAKKDWDWSKVYPGVNRKIDYNAQRLARTMVTHAYQEALQRTTQKNPFFTGYKWNNGRSHTEVCEVCKKRAREDHGLGMKGVYKKDELPLDHPNGKCFITVVQTMSSDDVVKSLADWYKGEGDPQMNKALDEYAKSMGYDPGK